MRFADLPIFDEYRASLGHLTAHVDPTEAQVLLRLTPTPETD